MTPEQYKKVLAALRVVSEAGVDVTTLHETVIARHAAWKDSPPDAVSSRYACPSTPPAIEDHLGDGEPKELSASALWPGYHYTLTPGQREWLRENTEMVPAQTATVGWVEVFKGTQCPRQFLLSNDVPKTYVASPVHVSVVIRNAGAFFAECAAKDAAMVKETAEKKTVKADSAKPKSYEDLLNNLASYINIK